MSKRFGRNQRRRAREQIERLASMYNEQTRINHHQKNRLNDFREHLRYVAATLGNMSVLSGGPVPIIEDGHDGMQVPVMKPLGAPLDFDPDETVCMEIMRLLDIQTVRDVARRMVHAVVKLNDETAAYAISEFTLRGMPSEQLARLIESKIAPMLAATLAAQMSTKV